MCGIAGCYQQPDGDALTRALVGALGHRGPDAQGVHRSLGHGSSCQLGHSRLSIIDLSTAANQPFSRDGLTLTYNGELYNYRSLRGELARAGVEFTTSSDTEVVLEAWRRWGPAALVRFRGMFAFAVFDDRTQRLVLARDQLGIKPLYVLPRHGGVVFASELKALVSVLGRELEVDRGAMVASILYYWVPDQRCSIRGVTKLQPGSWVEFRPDGTSTSHCYWSLPDVAAKASAGPPVPLGPVIEESVRAHLVADVPISAFLSGGLDSSIVTVLAKQANPQIDAYTITFRPDDQRLEAMPDDAIYARRVAKQFGIELHEIEIAPDVVDLLPRIANVLDEPIGDPAAINTVLICKAARAMGVKVLLSGMGADELFGGYRKHAACELAARYQRLPGMLRTRLIRPSVNRLPVAFAGRGLRRARWAKRFLTFAELPEEAAFRRSYTLYGPEEATGLLNPDLAPEVAGVIDEHREIYYDNALSDRINRMCLADARLFLPGLNLAYTDRASMSVSTEVRVPFVDVEVVKAAFSIPGRGKLKGRSGKLALKRAGERWLPRDVVYRPKASFSAPLRSWVSRDLRHLIDDVLVSGDLVSSGFLDRAGVAGLIADDRGGREDRSKQIWQLLSLELWYRNVRALGVSA